MKNSIRGSRRQLLFLILTLNGARSRLCLRTDRETVSTSLQNVNCPNTHTIFKEHAYVKHTLIACFEFTVSTVLSVDSE